MTGSLIDDTHANPLGSPIISSCPSVEAPSRWIFGALERLPVGSSVLDWACGYGRHALAAKRSQMEVTAVDKKSEVLGALSATKIETLCWDLEYGPLITQGPLKGRQFDLLIVCNYLWRPRLFELMNLIAPGGLLAYETFMVGHEQYGRPRRAEFLLLPDELLVLCHRYRLKVLDYQSGYSEDPAPAMRQRVLAQR